MSFDGEQYQYTKNKCHVGFLQTFASDPVRHLCHTTSYKIASVAVNSTSENNFPSQFNVIYRWVFNYRESLARWDVVFNHVV